MTDHDPGREDPGRGDVPYAPPGEPTQPLQGQTQPLSPQPPPPEPPPPESPPPEPPSVAGRSIPGRSNPLTAIEPGDLPLYAAAAIVVAVIALAFGALLIASGIDDNFGDDEWKFTVKTIGLGASLGFGGLGSGGAALFAGLGLIVAQHLARAAPAVRRPLASFVGIGTLAVAVWLLFFTALGVIVDFTFFGDDFVAALGVLLSDLGALAVLLVALAWGYQTFRARA